MPLKLTGLRISDGPPKMYMAVSTAVLGGLRRS